MRRNGSHFHLSFCNSNSTKVEVVLQSYRVENGTLFPLLHIQILSGLSVQKPPEYSGRDQRKNGHWWDLREH